LENELRKYYATKKRVPEEIWDRDYQIELGCPLYLLVSKRFRRNWYVKVGDYATTRGKSPG